jgi:membrane protease YdiL (CAAX protease family)
MKISTVVQFIIGFVVVLILAAFIAPLLSQFIDYDFDRILSRTVMVLFLVLAGIFLIKNRGFKFRDYGLFWDNYSATRLVHAFLLGFLTLSLMTFLEILIGVRAWQFTLHQTTWPLKLLKYLSSALVIGILEEFIFRGVLFNLLGKAFRLIPALIVTNIVYSLLHFIRYSGNEAISDPNFLTSFRIYVEIMEPFTRFGQIWVGAIGLFIFGMVLSYAYLRTGKNLIFSIGIHAGAVFFLKLDRWFVHIESEAQKIWFGGTDLHACILGWIFALLMVPVVYYLTKKKKAYA